MMVTGSTPNLGLCQGKTHTVSRQGGLINFASCDADRAAPPIFNAISHGTFIYSVYYFSAISRKDIKSYVAALAGQFAPERVILFGSYARGNPHEDSKDAEQAVAIDIQLHRKFPLDLIVRRPSEIKKRLSMGDMFLSTILKEGVVLHERRP